MGIGGLALAAEMSGLTFLRNIFGFFLFYSATSAWFVVSPVQGVFRRLITPKILNIFDLRFKERERLDEPAGSWPSTWTSRTGEWRTTCEAGILISFFYGITSR